MQTYNFMDSATITNIAGTNINVDNINIGDSTYNEYRKLVLTAKAITGTSANVDSATIGNMEATNISVDNIESIGDSATITSIASNSINTNAINSR